MTSTLHDFIAKLLAARRISAPEAQQYSQQIKHLLLQTSLDGLSQAINNALQSEKFRLAAHYINTALEKMARQNDQGQYNSRIATFQQQLAEIEPHIKPLESVAEASDIDREWDELDQADESWKKKKIYD